MLALLTDAHISPKVALQLAGRYPDGIFHSLRSWRNGVLLEEEDTVILEAALQENLTLVTYDQRTILPTIVEWMNTGKVHNGVLFVDERSIAQEDIGGLVKALGALWEKDQDFSWENVVSYLKPPS